MIGNLCDSLKRFGIFLFAEQVFKFELSLFFILINFSKYATFLCTSMKTFTNLPHFADAAGILKPNLYSFGVCSTDLRLDTSTKGLKQVYTSTKEI